MRSKSPPTQLSPTARGVADERPHPLCGGMRPTTSVRRAAAGVVRVDRMANPLRAAGDGGRRAGAGAGRVICVFYAAGAGGCAAAPHSGQTAPGASPARS